MASSAGWPSRIAARNRRASPACSGVAGKRRDHPISGAVLVSRMLSPDAGVAGLMKRLLVVILIRQALLEFHESPEAPEYFQSVGHWPDDLDPR